MSTDSTQVIGQSQAAARDAHAQAAVRPKGATIGPKTQIKGDLQAEEDLLIEGSFTGTLVLRKHQLTIGAAGRISGTAFANVVIVDGQIEGDLYASERISIRKGAKVKGSILSPRVSLEDGASLRGSVEMDPQEIAQAIKEKFGEAEKPAAPASAPAPAAPQLSAVSSHGKEPAKPGVMPGKPVGAGGKDAAPNAASANK